MACSESRCNRKGPTAGLASLVVAAGLVVAGIAVYKKVLGGKSIATGISDMLDRCDSAAKELDQRMRSNFRATG